MSFTEKELLPYVDQHLDEMPFSKEGRTVRWITRQIYVDIQCLILAAQLQNKMDVAREECKHDIVAEERMLGLLRCETDDDKHQWLQNYKGRALLTCNLCGTMDVEAVLEIKDANSRQRLCPRCCAKMNLHRIQGGPPKRSPDVLAAGLRELKRNLPDG